MSAFSDFFVNLFSGAIASAGQTKLVEVLQDLHDSDIEAYKAAIYGGKALTSKLLPVVTETGTEIDDAILSAVSEAVEESAAANGIEL